MTRITIAVSVFFSPQIPSAFSASSRLDALSVRTEWSGEVVQRMVPFDDLEEWFLRGLDPASRAAVLTVHNFEAAGMLIEMQSCLSSSKGRGRGETMFSFEGVAQYRDLNAYGQWCALPRRFPSPLPSALTAAAHVTTPMQRTAWVRQ